MYHFLYIKIIQYIEYGVNTFRTKVHNYLLLMSLCSFNSSMNSLTLSARLCLNAYNFLFSINVLSLKPDKEKSYGLPTVDCFFMILICLFL